MPPEALGRIAYYHIIDYNIYIGGTHYETS